MTDLNQKEAQLIESSWNWIVMNDPDFGLLFYNRLFTRYPDLKRLFHRDITVQSHKIISMVSFFVTRIHDRETRTRILRLLGHRHVQYQVKYEHYDMVGEILLSALEETMADRCDAETRNAWKKFCGNIFEEMLYAYSK